MRGAGGKGRPVAPGRAPGVVSAPAAVPALAVLFALAALAGCVTPPAPPDVSLVDYLLPGQSAYFAVHVAGNQDLFAGMAGALDSRAERIIRRVDRVAGSVQMAPEGLAPRGPASPEREPVEAVRIVPDISLVATGRLPSGATRYALRRDRAFTRQVATVSGQRVVYFRQDDGVIEIAPAAAGLILLSTGSVLRLLPSVTGDARPDGPGSIDLYAAQHVRSVGTAGAPDMVIIFVDPASLLVARGVDLPGFPITRLALAVTIGEAARDPGESRESGDASGAAARAELSGELVLRTPREAALFARLGRVFVLAFVRALGLEGESVREHLEIVVMEDTVVFRGIPVTVEELSGLALRVVS